MRIPSFPTQKVKEIDQNLYVYIYILFLTHLLYTHIYSISIRNHRHIIILIYIYIDYINSRLIMDFSYMDCDCRWFLLKCRKNVLKAPRDKQHVETTVGPPFFTAVELAPTH